MKGYFQKILSTETLKSYSPVIQWYTVRLMLILQCVIILKIQSICFANAFAQADITSGYPLLVEPPRNFKSDGLQCDIVVRLKRVLYGKAKASRIWYEKLQFFC